MSKQLDSRLYLTSQEAAAALNISVTSLYSYVSRGLIKSQSTHGSRKRGYLRSDITALKDRQNGDKNDHNFFLEPDLRQDKITQITESGPVYRGKDAGALARTESLESVAEWLWQVDHSPFATAPNPVIPKNLGALRKQFEHLSPLNQYISLSASIEQANPRAYNLSAQSVAHTGVDAIRWLTSCVANSDEYPGMTPLHTYIANKRGVNKGYAELLRATMILVADHQQGPASFAAKNVAYAGNTPYSVVSSGLITWQGAFVMKGMVQPLTHFVAEIMNNPDPTTAISSRLQEGTPLPGFDHPVYGAKDPRGALLIELTDEYLHDDPDARKLCQAASIAEDITDRSPSLNLITTFLAYKLGMPSQMRAFTAVGRTIGWLAHAFETYKVNNPYNHKVTSNNKEG